MSENVYRVSEVAIDPGRHHKDESNLWAARYPFVTLEWARQWPCEEVWKARKTR